MNIFYLDHDTKLCAQYHVDKHVVKMIIEYAQLMSTAHRILDGTQYLDKTKSGNKIKRWKLDEYREPVMYKASHINHPSAIWARESHENYQWLWRLFRDLCQEYRHRYGGETDKQHKTSLMLSPLSYSPVNINRFGLFTDPPQAMPADAKIPGNSLEAYRNYYRLYKKDFATWKNRPIPEWYSKPK